MVPVTKQAHSKQSLNLWLESASEKSRPEVITRALELLEGMDILEGGGDSEGCVHLRDKIPLAHICRLTGPRIQCTSNSRSMVVAEGV